MEREMIKEGSYDGALRFLNGLKDKAGLFDDFVENHSFGDLSEMNIKDVIKMAGNGLSKLPFTALWLIREGKELGERVMESDQVQEIKAAVHEKYDMFRENLNESGNVFEAVSDMIPDKFRDFAATVGDTVNSVVHLPVLDGLISAVKDQVPVLNRQPDGERVSVWESGVSNEQTIEHDDADMEI